MYVLYIYIYIYIHESEFATGLDAATQIVVAARVCLVPQLLRNHLRLPGG